MCEKILAEKLMRNLEEKNLDIKDLAKLIGYEASYLKSTLYKMQKGRSQSFSFSCFFAISTTLNLTLKDFT